MLKMLVGHPYPLPIHSHAGASANFLNEHGSVLQINLDNITRDELYVLKKGKIKAGFLYENGNILWLFRIFNKKAPMFTFDCPFDIRLGDVKHLSHYNINNQEERIVIDIHVVDNGIVKALRSITMPHELTVSFLSSVQDQLTTVPTNNPLNKWFSMDLDELYKMTKTYVLGL